MSFMCFLHKEDTQATRSVGLRSVQKGLFFREQDVFSTLCKGLNRSVPNINPLYFLQRLHSSDSGHEGNVFIIVIKQIAKAR